MTNPVYPAADITIATEAKARQQEEENKRLRLVIGELEGQLDELRRAVAGASALLGIAAERR